MKNLIITSCYARKPYYEEFLANHWLKSLKENFDLSSFDVVVLNYRMSKHRVQDLKKQGVIVKNCILPENHHVTLERFKGMADFLKNKKYNQVLAVDGSDVIFQANFQEIFEKDKQELRAVCEEVFIPFDAFLSKKCFSKEDYLRIRKLLKNKRMINAGVLLGSAKKFRLLCMEVFSLLKNLENFGPDQVAVNYILYRDGFKELDSKYNFVATTTKEKFFIKDSEFFLESGEKIPIVHNAGAHRVFRTVKNFGFGKGHNKLDTGKYHLLRAFFRIVQKILKLSKN